MTLSINLKYILFICYLTSNILVAQKDSKSLKNNSPYDFSLKKELPFIGVGIGLFSTAAYLSKTNTTAPFTIIELNTLNRNDINKFDRGATYNHSISAANTSDYITYSSIVLPLLFLGEKSTRNDIFNLILLAAEVGSITTGITHITKNTVNRARPYTYNSSFSINERRDEKSRVSFYSGHASTTAAYSFFVAKVINDYHPEMKKGYRIGLWSFAALIPASTSYFRVKAGKHYPTDVITGFTIGALVGFLVPQLHKKREHKKVSYYLSPYNFDGANGLSLTCKF